jgi:hypothetical protein
MCLEFRRKFQGLWQDHLGGAEHSDGDQTVRQPVLEGPCFFIRGDRLIWLTDDGRPSGHEERITLNIKAIDTTCRWTSGIIASCMRS